jgi:hypothetical protein
MMVGFDDSSWQYAQVITERESPWSSLEKRQTPLMEEKERFPEAVVQVGEVMEFAKTAAAGQIPERLATEPQFPQTYTTINNPDGVLAPDTKSAVMQSTGFRQGDDLEQGVRSPYIIVDFGKPVFGFPRITLEVPQEGDDESASVTVDGGMIKLTRGPGGSLDMTYSLDMIGDRILPLTGGPRFGDRYVMRRGKQTWQTFEYKMFRYLKIVMRDVEQPVKIHSVSVMSYVYPATRRGSFECSDTILTALWKACVDTTYPHIEDTVLCDAWRERRCYNVDGAHGLYGIWAGYGDLSVTDWYFRLFSRGQLPDGAMRAHYPGTEGRPDEVRDIMKATAYDTPDLIPYATLYFPYLATGDYYAYFGKTGLTEELFPVLERAVDWCERHTDESGLLYNLPYWNFFDWAPNETKGANFQINALYYCMLINLSRVAKDLGKTKLAEKWRERAETVRSTLQEKHWNDKAGLFVASVIEGQQVELFTELANGIALYSGIPTGEQTQRIVEQLINPSVTIYPPSPLNLYYVLEGLIKAGAPEKAQQIMRERYRPMLEFSDVPTMWESWNPYARERGTLIGRELYVGELPSFIHSGSVGPAWTLSKHILGVYPEGAGFRKCRIEPQIGKLQWAKGVVPSVRGDIGVDWKKRDGRLSLHVELPEGLETSVSVPSDSSVGYEVVVDGISYSTSTVHYTDETPIPAVQDISGEHKASTVRVSEPVDTNGRKITVTFTGGSHTIEYKQTNK